MKHVLENSTYGDLGIDAANVVDDTPDSGITAEDAEQIANELLKDENLTKQYLTAYYTNKIRDQYNAVRGSQEEEPPDNNWNSQSQGGTTP